MSIRVVVVEDQGMVLGALAALLELEADLQVVGRAVDGKEALDLLSTIETDVVITDIEMPRLNGLDLAEQLRRTQPDVRVIIVTTFARPGYLRRALDAGVRGYLLKDSPAEQLADAVRRVHSGQRVIAPDLAVSAWEEPSPLSGRQRKILALVGEGCSTREISNRLHLAEGTVRNYLSDAIGELQAANRVDAYRIARQKGWL